MKGSVLGQIAQLLIQHSQTLTRDFIRVDVIDTDLQILEPGLVQPLNSLRREVVTVGNKSGDNAVRANMPDDVIELRMHHRFAARDSHDRSAQVTQFVYSAFHDIQGYRL